jgi:phospholipid/cholesterol/gamma-HCH transport system substrate-binding protein
VLAVTAGRQAELRRATRALAPGLRGARRTLDAVGSGIPALTSVAVVSGPALKELAPTARAIRPAISALRPLLREARALIRATPEQVRRIRGVLRAALPVIERLQPLLEGAGPLNDYLRAFAPEVMGFFTTWGDAAANYDAAGTLARLGFSPGNAERHNQVIESDAGPVAGLIERPFFRMPGSLERSEDAWPDYADSFISGGKSADELLGGSR